MEMRCARAGKRTLALEEKILREEPTAGERLIYRAPSRHMSPTTRRYYNRPKQRLDQETPSRAAASSI